MRVLQESTNSHGHSCGDVYMTLCVAVSPCLSIRQHQRHEPSYLYSSCVMMTTGMMVAGAKTSAPAAATEAGVQASNRAVVDLRDRGMAAAPAAAGPGAGVTMGGGGVTPRVKAGTAVPQALAGRLLLLAPGLQTATCQRASGMAESSGQGDPSKEKKRKNKTTPFGVNLTRSLAVYQAAQKGLHACSES